MFNMSDDSKDVINSLISSKAMIEFLEKKFERARAIKFIWIN